jgi:hypothetical protein
MAQSRANCQSHGEVLCAAVEAGRPGFPPSRCLDQGLRGYSSQPPQKPQMIGGWGRYCRPPLLWQRVPRYIDSVGENPVSARQLHAASSDGLESTTTTDPRKENCNDSALHCSTENVFVTLSTNSRAASTGLGANRFLPNSTCLKRVLSEYVEPHARLGRKRKAGGTAKAAPTD